METEQAVGPGPEEIGPEGAVGGERAEEAVEEEEALEGDAPAARGAEAASEGEGEGLEGRGRNGEDFQELVDVTLLEGQVVGCGCLDEDEIDVTKSSG